MKFTIARVDKKTTYNYNEEISFDVKFSPLIICRREKCSKNKQQKLVDKKNKHLLRKLCIYEDNNKPYILQGF